MKHHKVGDILKITIFGEDGGYVRNVIIFEHTPDTNRAYRYSNTDADWTYHFYKYLDMDSGALNRGHLPYDSTEAFKIEKS